MEEGVAKTRLSKLTERQREVLKYFCEGKPYKEIGKLLHVAEKTVRVHMGNIYIKLELDYLEAAERRKLLFQVFCPLLKEDLPPPPKEPKELVPVPPIIEKKVTEDEYALVTVEPIVIKSIDPPHPRRRRGCLLSGALLLIGPAIGIAGTVLVLNWLGIINIGETVAQETSTAIPAEIALETALEELPTEPQTAQETQTIASPTLAPLPTAISAPLPFSDNFNNGAKPEWDVVVGNWRMVDGAYTADSDGGWNVSLVGSESWRDIAIDVDVITDDWNYPVRIIVRAYQGSYLIMETNCCSTYFILIDNGTETTIAESDAGGLTGSIYLHTNNIRIEALNNIYTVYVDGVKLLTVQDNTLPTGRVGLGLDYEARYDNFLVESIPD